MMYHISKISWVGARKIIMASCNNNPVIFHNFVTNIKSNNVKTGHYLQTFWTFSKKKKRKVIHLATRGIFI